MTVADGDVAVLARQAVDLLSPDIAIDIDPVDSGDPYRWGRAAWVVWPLIDGHRSFGIRLDAGQTAAEALARLLEQLSENVSGTALFRGVDFPPCPGHPHPAEIAVEGNDVVLRCPTATGQTVRRLTPDLPA